jgi:hypothetical protein
VVGGFCRAIKKGPHPVLKLMVDPNVPASVRLRASEFVVTHSAKAIELEDIEARVSELERAAEASKPGR